jgi:hypothetical protein
MDNKRIVDGKPLDCRGVYCGSKANNNIEGSDKSMNMYIMDKVKLDRHGKPVFHKIKYKSIVLDMIERVKTLHRMKKFIKKFKNLDNNPMSNTAAENPLSSIGEKL